MDSTEYFARAEKANRRYHRVMIIIGLSVTVALTITMLILFKINQTNHDDSTAVQQTIIDNEVKLNQNLANSLHCVLNLTVGKAPGYSIQTINSCFDSKNNLVDPKGS